MWLLLQNHSQAPSGFSTTRPCNRFPCPGTLASWTVGPWTSCVPLATPVRPCEGGPGIQTRAVTCQSTDAAARGGSSDSLPDTECLQSGALNVTRKPAQSAPCTLVPTCDCLGDSDCPSNHWVCNSVSRRCECSRQWGGDGCDVPLLAAAPAAPSCEDGVVDVSGGCCRGYIDAVTGHCCPEGAGVDWAGRCCIAGPQAVDACGECGGHGVAVDVTGVCCVSALLPSGLCCVHGEVDSCGVCGGLNNCTYVDV